MQSIFSTNEPRRGALAGLTSVLDPRGGAALGVASGKFLPPRVVFQEEARRPNKSRCAYWALAGRGLSLRLAGVLTTEGTGMALCLTRKSGEAIDIGEGLIVVRVTKIDGNHVHVAIECPRDIPIRRTELPVKQEEGAVA